jgi:hypothetical protein
MCEDGTKIRSGGFLVLCNPVSCKHRPALSLHFSFWSLPISTDTSRPPERRRDIVSVEENN